MGKPLTAEHKRKISMGMKKYAMISRRCHTTDGLKYATKVTQKKKVKKKVKKTTGGDMGKRLGDVTRKLEAKEKRRAAIRKDVALSRRIRG